MKIAQVNLAVPDEIYSDIMKGTLEIAAGVVRDNKGVIRKHLPKVANVAKDNKAVKAVAANKNAIQIVKNLKVVGIVVGAAAAVGGGVAYMVHRHKEKKAEALEECIANFQNALKAYLKAAKAGAINAKVVDNLLEALEEVRNSKAGDAVMLSIPATQLNQLINSIFDYTRQLAEANAFTDAHVKSPKRGSKNSMVNLQSYLEIQKQIIAKAA